MKWLCKHGHDTLIVGRTTNGTCKTCVSNRWLVWKMINKELSNTWHKKWRKEHPDKVRAAFKRCYLKKKAERMTFLNRFKNKPCADCQGWFEPCQMDFDHRNPKLKVNSISKMGWDSRSLTAIKTEIQKCDLVCANCHRLRTREQYAKR